MAMDSTTAYGPSRSLPSTSISDSTATGRALLTAASAAAARTVLGIEDVTDQVAQSLAHAKTVCSFTYTPLVYEYRSDQKIGNTNGGWGSVILSGSSTNTVDTAGEYGGASIMATSGLSGGQVQWLSVSNGLGTFAGSVMPDLVRAQDKWHLEFDFKLTSTPDAQTEFGQGWIAPDGTGGPVAGVRGAQSTAFFRFYMAGSSTGVNSTVAVNTSRNRARVWANGSTPGQIFGSINGETPVSFTGAAFGKAGGPYGQITNGTTLAAQTVEIYNSIYVIEGVA